MAEIWDDIQVKPADGTHTDEQDIKDMGLNPDAEVSPSSPMRKVKVIRQFRQAQGWWAEARRLQLDQRLRKLKDHNAYEGEQWDPDDVATLESRGQKALTINLIKPCLDWIIGTEKRMRVDYKVLPRTADDTQGAEAKTKVMKYTEDVNWAVYHRSRAATDAFISGLGWLEEGIRDDPEDELIYYRYEDWRNIWYDPHAVEMDLSDAKYIIRTKIVDLDISVAMFPEHAGAIRTAAIRGDTFYDYNPGRDDSEITVESEDGESENTEGDSYDRRSRVRMIECWYVKPEKRKFIEGEGLGTLKGAPYDEGNKAVKELVEAGHASTYDALQKTVRCMMWVEGMTYPLQDARSPYNHNKFPFIPVWGYRRKKYNESYGVVRNLLDMQDDLNKRHSKSLYLLATNRIIADDDATDDWDALYREANRPDGVVKKKRGAAVELHNDAVLAREHTQIMQMDAQMIQNASGVTDENLGKKTNAISGRAIERRQDQGHVVTAELFDNQRMAIQIAGEIELSLIEQFMTEEKVCRVTGEKGRMEFVYVNRQQPDERGELNDITARKADFVVDTQAYNATLRQTMFESLMELAKTLPPEVTLNLLDLIIDASDIPGKDDLVARIRAINGQEDPNADPNDPEVMQRKQAQMDAQAKQEELQAIIEELQIALQQAEVEKLNAEADKTTAEIDKVDAETSKIRAEIPMARQKMTIERAKALSQIEAAERMPKIAPRPVKKKAA